MKNFLQTRSKVNNPQNKLIFFLFVNKRKILYFISPIQNFVNPLVLKRMEKSVTGKYGFILFTVNMSRISYIMLKKCQVFLS